MPKKLTELTPFERIHRKLTRHCKNLFFKWDDNGHGRDINAAVDSESALLDLIEDEIDRITAERDAALWSLRLARKEAADLRAYVPATVLAKVAGIPMRGAQESIVAAVGSYSKPIP